MDPLLLAPHSDGSEAARYQSQQPVATTLSRGAMIGLRLSTNLEQEVR